jgi:hypothetical protein
MLAPEVGPALSTRTFAAEIVFVPEKRNRYANATRATSAAIPTNNNLGERFLLLGDGAGARSIFKLLNRSLRFF